MAYTSIQVGNAATDAYSDNLGATDFYYYHSLISDDTYKQLKENCDFAYDLPVDYSLRNATCLNTSNYALDVVMREINLYNIYGPWCNPPATTAGRPAFVKVPLLCPPFRVIPGWYSGDTCVIPV
jgi:serine carboxypeptidase-like clade 2